MIELKVYKPTGCLIHVTGNMGAGKTTLLGDMLYNELDLGDTAFLMTRREGNKDGGSWSILPDKVKEHSRILILETLKDLDDLFKDWKRKPLQAIGFDTSTGLELLIKTSITGDENVELKSQGGKFQHKEFLAKLSYYLQSMRDVAKYNMMVSPAVTTTYNTEKGDIEVGKSGTAMDADKRFEPEGENRNAKLRLLYSCDYAFHITQSEMRSTGDVKGRTLIMQPNLKMMTKARTPLGKVLKNMELNDQIGSNWPLIKTQIQGAFE